ncbi:MAG: vitamin K epoxide reductase family protein [Nitrososphaerota archaeon]|nr:vitamin K epoxide reductase family protein [Nitrososphaerota archaeon]MDG6939140.1 vitamin K epoxide reductase family protein [Nitrososphaerota archaeon]
MNDLRAKLFVALALAGLAIASYIVYEQATGSFTSCTISATISCQGVFASGRTSIFGVPFAYLGLGWFVLVLGAGLLSTRWVTGPIRDPASLFYFLMIGNAFTVYLWYVQLALIGVVCPLCASSYAVNYALTLIALWSAARREPPP